MSRALLIGLLLGCSASSELDTTGQLLPVADAPGVETGGLSCDTSDEVFARRLVVALWGRRALSVHELSALVAIAEAQGREALVDAMLGSSELGEAWSWWLNDWLYFNRAGERGNAACFADSALPPDRGDVAAWVRDHGPTGEPYPGGDFTLVDLLRSTIELDDLSPVIRAQPFLQVASWVIQADNPEHELATRRLYARIFESQVLNRRLECLSCHNSAWSVTDSPDPLLDRSWPASGRIEDGVFGDDTGLDPDLISALFRIRDVMSLELRENTNDLWFRGEGLRPWGMAAGCGQFEPPETLPTDWLEDKAYLVQDFGDRASIYDLEGLLRTAFDQARGEPLDFSPSSTPDGLTALVQMIALSVSEAIWEEVTGRPLTAPYNLPRNAMQRDVLQHLASTFVSSGYSLKAVLRATVLHPYFAQSAPADCAAGLDVYYLSPIYDPWSIESATAQMHGNSVGDQVSRLPARILLRSLTSALEWPPMPRFFPQDDTVEQVKLSPIAEMQRDIGAFMTDGEIGFRGSTFQETLAWESAFGGCRPPDAMTIEAPDFIDALEIASAGRPFRDAVAALKDRLLADPNISSPGEEDILEALSGYELDSGLDDLPDANGALRRICTAFISSPQFLLFGITPESRLVSGLGDSLPGVSQEMHCNRISTLVSNAVCTGGTLQITR